MGGHGHRLDLVMGDIDGRRAVARCSRISSVRISTRNLAFEVRQRLVEQKHPGRGAMVRAIATLCCCPPEISFG